MVRFLFGGEIRKSRDWRDAGRLTSRTLFDDLQAQRVEGLQMMSSVGSAQNVRATGTPEDHFTTDVYMGINKARWAFFEPLLAEIADKTSVRSVLDVGAGIGYFAEQLHRAGYQTTAVDGRLENVEAIRKLVRGVKADVADVQSRGSLAPFGGVDAIFCAGLLYHLDNPAGGVANLCDTGARVMLIETQVAPGNEPTFRLVEEGVSFTQGLNYFAIVPSVTALARLFRLNGWPYVYLAKGAPDHPQFAETKGFHALRKVLVVSRQPVASDLWSELPDVVAKKGFHAKPTWRSRLKLLVQGR